MTDPIVLDEFHVSLLVSAGLDESRVQAARRALARPVFRARLRRAVRAVLDLLSATRPLAAEVTQ